MHRININKLHSHAQSFAFGISTNPTSLSNLLPAEKINQHINHIEYRERIYSPPVVIWGLLAQVLSDDHSCQLAVAKTIVHFIKHNKQPPSSNTSAYCKARARLPESVLSGLAHDIARESEASTPSSWLWKDKCIKLIDGSTISMPDTIANQAIYPQSNCQSKGLGFPVARIAAIISYATGSVLEFAVGAFKGKGASELALIRKLLPTLNRNDVVIADSYYANYFMISALSKSQVDFVFPIHHSRNYDFSKGQQLGRKDHVVSWKKPKKPDWMDIQSYEQFPDALTLREVAVDNYQKGFRSTQKILVTSFTTNKEASRECLSELYRYRWHVELDLRSIKDVMHMDILRGKTPQMVHKEIWAHILAYNLIRRVMIDGAKLVDKHPRELSFKLAMQAVVSFRDAGMFKQQHYESLLCVISSKTVGNRPGRYEPRRIKRRPKPWDLLLKPRASYQIEVFGSA